MIVHIVDNRYPPLKYDWFVLLTLEILKSLLYIYVLELIFLQNTSSVLILTNSDFFNFFGICTEGGGEGSALDPF